MTSKFSELAIDWCRSQRSRRFWCSVLGYEVQDEDDGIVTIGSLWCMKARTTLVQCHRR